MSILDTNHTCGIINEIAFKLLINYFLVSKEDERTNDWRIVKTEAALLPDDRTDLVSIRIGWDMAGYNRNWPISKPSCKLDTRMDVILAVIGCPPWSCSRFVEIKAVR